MILIDTSALVDSLTGPKRSAGSLRALLADGERVVLASLVAFEWLRGPRLEQELALQEALFPVAAALPFGADEARVAAELYRSVSRPRGREIDLAIAACAIVRDALLWTANPEDFRDVPRLRLHEPVSGGG